MFSSHVYNAYKSKRLFGLLLPKIRKKNLFFALTLAKNR